LVYAFLIAYASLFPFAHWRYQGVATFAFWTAPLPRYWTRFDIGVNVIGYLPLGFLFAWALLRRRTVVWAVLVATALSAAMSVCMETMQTFLPSRVPSNLDAALNTCGGLLGALLARGAQRLGMLNYWTRLKQGWFDAEPRGALVLLALWPLALIFPTTLPFGLGQVAERVLDTLTRWLGETPFTQWLPESAPPLEPLTIGTAWACSLFGLMAPSLLAYSVIRDPFRRWCTMLVITGVGLTMTAASTVLSFGPDHAWDWVTPSAKAAVVTSLVFSSFLLWLPRRASLVVLLVTLAFQLSRLNNSPMSSYLTETLSTWEQGRFARFNGLAQWLGWSWPYVLMVYAGVRLSRRGTRPSAT
jgi:VanZ family protein